MALEAPPAPAEAEVDALVAGTELDAIDAVAEREGTVEEVRIEHHRALEELLQERKEKKGDTESATTDPRYDLARQEIDRRADTREARFNDDVQVGHLPGSVAGVQEDGSRAVTIDADLVHSAADDEQAREVNNHEFRHTQQAAGTESAPPPKTGDQATDKKLELDARAYREADAMEYAGSAHTSAQYHEDYLDPVREVSAYLDQGGEDGKQLVENAAIKGEVAEVRQAILRVHIQEQLVLAA